MADVVQDDWAACKAAGWATVIRSTDAGTPTLKGWKTIKLTIPNVVDEIPTVTFEDGHTHGPVKYPDPKRVAYVLYDPDRWVWAGTQVTDTCTFLVRGHGYYLSRR